jgi:hypothetical protein
VRCDQAAEVVADGNAPQVAAMVFHHLAIDLTGVALLNAQIATLLTEPGQRVVRPRVHQPLDQTAAECSPGGRRRAEAASRHWAKVLMSMPQCNFPLPHDDRREPGRPLAGWLWSRGAAIALPHVVARTGVSSPIVVLAALAAVLTARSGQPHCVMQALSNNRFEPRLRDYVGVLAADGLVSIEDANSAGFDDVVVRTGTAMLQAGLCSPIDPVEKANLIEAAQHRRGIHYARYCTFNDVSTAYTPRLTVPPALGDPAAAEHVLAETRLVWLDWPHASEMLGFRLLQKDEGFHLGAIARDRSQIGRAEMELLLRGVERLLVAAATGDVDLRSLAGVPPRARGGQWRMVDRCWVEMPEAQRLLQDAVRSPLARVFAEQGDTVVVGYLPAGLVASPRAAHDACVALLPGRSTAMAPHRYVICDGVPADPDQQAGWRDLHVLATGDGR